MIRERALKVVLVIVGLLFLAGVYALTQPIQPEEQMLGGVYATLGIFLLLALRNPSENRSLIAFTAWSSFIHASVMTVQSLHDVAERAHLRIGSIAFLVIGLALLLLAGNLNLKQHVDSISRRTHGTAY